MFHGEQINEGWDNLLDGKASQSVLVAHDQHLAHLDDRGQLDGLVGTRESREQLLHLGGGATGGATASHASVQQMLHAGTERPEQVGRQTPRLQQRLKTSHLNKGLRSTHFEGRVKKKKSGGQQKSREVKRHAYGAATRQQAATTNFNVWMRGGREGRGRGRITAQMHKTPRNQRIRGNVSRPGQL